MQEGMVHSYHQAQRLLTTGFMEEEEEGLAPLVVTR
jgi:hypothetical protein